MQIVSLILTILFFVFILSGVLWGIIRGLKKTISRGLFLIITSVILIFVTMPITKALINIPLNVSSFTINEVTISGSMSIEQLFNQGLKALLGNDFAHSSTIIESASALIIGVVSSIIYLVLFWALKYILLPINHLISKLIIRKKKQNPEVMAFSAFGENPDNNEQNDSIFNLDAPSNNEKNSVTLGSIFDPQNQPDEMPVTPVESEPTTPKVDNSLFTQEILDQQNQEAGLFIKNDSQIIAGTPDTPHVEMNTNEPPASDKKHKPIKEKKQKEKKQKEKKQKPDKFLKPKENKYRFWGGLVGAVVGLVVMINTMVPIYGVMNIVKNANQLELNNLSDTPISTSSLTNGISDDLINTYSSSVMGAVSSALGFEAIGVAEYDTITSVKINGKKITHRKDINQLIQVLKDVDSLAGYYKEIATDGTLTNVSQKQLDELLNKLDIVLKSTKEVKIIDALGEIVIPTISQALVKSNFKLTENVNVNYLFTNTLTSLSKANNINIINEISSIIDLIKYTNNQNLLLPIINSNTTEIFTNLMNVEEGFSTNLVNKLYALRTVDIAMPNIVNIGLTLLSESADFAFERCELDGSKVKSDITNIITSLIDTANSFDKDSSSLVTLESLPPIGRLLNSLKNASFLSTTTYNSLLDYAGGKLSDALSDSLPEELGNYTNDVLIDNFENVKDWESDLISLKNAINVLRDKEDGIIGSVVEDSNLREGLHFNDFEVNESTLINIGLALDKLENTDLFGTTHTFEVDEESYTGDGVSRLVYYLLNIAKNEIKDDESTEIKDLDNTLNTMQNNLLNNFPANPGEKYWENEFKAIAPLIDELYSQTSDGGEFEITATLGVSLDKASTSLLLGGNTTFSLVADMIDNIKSSETEGVDEEINKLIDNIISKLRNPSQFESKTKFWEIELDYIDSLMDIDFEDDIKSHLTTIGQTLDNVVFGQSDNPATSNVNEAVRNSYLIVHEDVRNILSTAITDNMSSLTSSFDDIGEPIEKAINSINYNIKNLTNYSFEFELTKLKTLSEIELSSNVFKYTDNQEILTQNKNAVTTLGKKLDTISFNLANPSGVISYKESSNSKVITRTILNTLVSDLLSQINNKSADNSDDTALYTAMQGLITDIQSNITAKNDYVISWARELSFIHKLTEINSDMTYTFDTTGNANRINLARTLDSIAFVTNAGNTQYEDIVYNANKEITYLPSSGNSLFITRENLKDTVSEILIEIQEEDPDTSSINKEDIINELIDKTTSTISTTTPADNVSNGYSNFENSFSDLNEIENELTSKLDTIGENSDITTLKDNQTINSLDETLQSFQNKPISGIITTRKIAYVILQDISIPAILQSTDTYSFYNKLHSEFSSNIKSTTSEEYYISSSDDLTDLSNRNYPFRKLLNTIV